MAAGPEPDAHGGRTGGQVQHPVSASARLEFQSGAIHAHSPVHSRTLREPPESVAQCGPTVAQFILFPADAECVARKRLWRGKQWSQHAQFQQSRLLQPQLRWRGRGPLLWWSWPVTFTLNKNIRLLL